MWRYTNTYEILQHHGVIGQRWGIRRYQNPDGSLTPQGMLRYHYSTGEKLSRKDRKKAKAYQESPGTTSYQKVQNLRSKKNVYNEKDPLDRTDLTKERSIPKGTTFYRTTVDPQEKDSGSRYMTYLDVDRSFYKGGVIRYQLGGKDTYEISYTLNKDLKIPSRDTQLKSIEKVCRNNSRVYNELAKATLKRGYQQQFDTEAELSSWIKKSPEAKKMSKKLIDAYKKEPVSDMMYRSAQVFGYDQKIRQAVIDDLKKKGYNAMSDLAGVGGKGDQQAEGYDPLIVFNAKDVKRTSVSKVSAEEENAAARYYSKWKESSGLNTANSPWVSEEKLKRFNSRW